jgi:hypothetical protein
MEVLIDQAGQYGSAAQVNRLGALRDLDAIGGTDVGNPIASNKHNLICQHCSGFWVEQLTGPNH